MNFEAICRTCLSEKTEMSSIFDTYNFAITKIEIFKVIIDCASIQIQKFDGFSDKICRSCLDNLSQAYSFKKLCEQSDYKFRNKLIGNKEIEIKNEFSADDTLITYGEIYSRKSAEEDIKMSEVFLTDVERGQCDDVITTENKSGKNQNNLKKSDMKRKKKIIRNKHIKSQKGEQEYNCNICEKKFTLRSTLIKHSRLHSGEKPFKCNFCEKNFATSSYLAIHVRIHTGDKPYKCDLCEKKFTQGSALANHMTLHTGERKYKCNFCEKTFRTSSNLIPHIRMHTGSKQYKCEFCEKEFTFKSNLTTHVRIHTGEKPFNCDICEKTFSRSRDLTAHISLHTTNMESNGES